MPTYDYVCSTNGLGCQRKFEIMQGIKEEPVKRCPMCNQETLVRLIGAGLPPSFKGTGFYQTDYKMPKSEPRKDGPS